MFCRSPKNRNGIIDYTSEHIRDNATLVYKSENNPDGNCQYFEEKVTLVSIIVEYIECVKKAFKS